MYIPFENKCDEIFELPQSSCIGTEKAEPSETQEKLWYWQCRTKDKFVEDINEKNEIFHRKNISNKVDK